MHLLIGKKTSIFDDLFLYRGLDENDLNNFVMVGQFLELAEENDFYRQNYCGCVYSRAAALALDAK